MDENKKILENIKAHDKICKQYEKKHGEIYNKIEQARLKKSLEMAAKEIGTGSESFKVLDFGCGAGNLTAHLLNIFPKVYASDVSKGFLEMIKHKFGEKVSTITLNGKDLSNIQDEEFDFVATYSVLHHVPDYLKVVEEFCRIIKPGGIIYIDHECSPSFWKQNNYYKEYRKKLKTEIRKRTLLKRFFHLLKISYWKDFFKSIIDPKFKAEGDIHVFIDDHIEWDKIESILDKNKFKTIHEQDFLLYRAPCSPELHEKYKILCDDSRYIISKKLINI